MKHKIKPKIYQPDNPENVNDALDKIYCIHGIALNKWCGTCEHESGTKAERIIGYSKRGNKQ